MSLQTTIYEGIDSVDREIWQAVTQGYPFAGYDWCHYGEAVLGDQIGYYVTVHEDDIAVGGASFWVLDREILPVDNPILRDLLARYIKARPLVVARTAKGTDHKGIYLPPDERKRAATLKAGLQSRTGYTAPMRRVISHV